MQKDRYLFRGQKVDTKEWVYGDLVMVFDGETLKRSPHIVISYNYDTFDWNEVIPDTVGQFTGLTDNNGVKIFEGDVIKVCNSYGYGFLSSGSVATIKWSDTECCYFIDGKFRLTKNRKIEVIGNIHDKYVL